MGYRFSTEDVHPRDRLAYWNDVACKAFVELECKTDVGNNFRAAIRSDVVAEISVSIVDSDQCNVQRTSHGISRSGTDDLLLSLQLSGTSVLSQDGRETQLGVGDFAIYDTTRSYSLKVTSGVRQLVLKLPRAALERRLGSVSALVASPVRGDSPTGSFASGFLALLPSRSQCIAALEGEGARQLEHQILDMVAFGFRGQTDLRNLSLSSKKSITLSRLKAAIEARLSDPTLRPAIAAAAIGVSTRYANELLSLEGTSLERYIMSRRLALCAKGLTDPMQRGRAICDVAYAWGFSDLSHFGRRFKLKFGCSPSEYRAGGPKADS